MDEIIDADGHESSWFRKAGRVLPASSMSQLKYWLLPIDMQMSRRGAVSTEQHLTKASAACSTTKTSEYLHLHPHVHTIKHYADKATEQGHGRNKKTRSGKLASSPNLKLNLRSNGCWSPRRMLGAGFPTQNN